MCIRDRRCMLPHRPMNARYLPSGDTSNRFIAHPSRPGWQMPFNTITTNLISFTNKNIHQTMLTHSSGKKRTKHYTRQTERGLHCLVSLCHVLKCPDNSAVHWISNRLQPSLCTMDLHVLLWFHSHINAKQCVDNVPCSYEWHELHTSFLLCIILTLFVKCELEVN